MDPPRKSRRNKKTTKIKNGKEYNADELLYDSLIEIRNIMDNYSNKIIEIPNTLINLTCLNVSNNQITEIPNTLIKLKELYCSGNQIIEIPNTLVNLKKLICHNNQIREIPSTLINLKELCHSGKIIKIPKT